MKKLTKTLLVLSLLLLACPAVKAEAANSLKIDSQKVAAKNTSDCDTSFYLYHNKLRLTFTVPDEPNATYKIYRKQAGKSWKVLHTFTVSEYCSVEVSGKIVSMIIDDYDCIELTDRNLKANTRYYYRIYSCNTGRYSNTASYWTAVKHPTGVKKYGRTIKWKKSKGASGYVVRYYKYGTKWSWSKMKYVRYKKWYCKAVSSKKKSYRVPRGYKPSKVYAYSKHNGGYYLSWSGVHSSKKSIIKHIKDGLLDDVIKRKETDW